MKNKNPGKTIVSLMVFVALVVFGAGCKPASLVQPVDEQVSRDEGSIYANGGIRFTLQTNGPTPEITKLLQAKADLSGFKDIIIYQQGSDKIIIDTTNDNIKEKEEIINMLLIPNQLEIQDKSGKTVLKNCIKEARSEKDSNGDYAVAGQFDEEGTKLFAEATAANVGKPLSIVFNGQVINSPMVMTAIKDGKFKIAGGFTAKEAEDLSILLLSTKYNGEVIILGKTTLLPGKN